MTKEKKKKKKRRKEGNELLVRNQNQKGKRTHNLQCKKNKPRIKIKPKKQ